MKKYILFIILAILLVSCQAISTPESTATLSATKTAIPTATNITVPTSTPIPPTLTSVPTLVNIDFEMPKEFAPFEKQFPLKIVNEFAGYLLRCAVDEAHFHSGGVSIGGKLEMRAWATCYFKNPDGRTDFVNIPLYVVEVGGQNYFVAYYPEPQPLAAGAHGFAVSAMDVMIPKWTKIITSKQVFVMGFGFGSTTLSNDASQSFFAPAVQKLNADAISKLATGNTSGLPTVNGIEHFLPAFEYLTDTVIK